jgi:hypothetical protein
MRAVAQRGQDDPPDPWRSGGPFPQEAFERCQAWMSDVARAEGKVVVGRIGREVGRDGKALT